MIHLRRIFKYDLHVIGFIIVVLCRGLILPLFVFLIIDELECRLLVHLVLHVFLKPQHILARVRLLNVNERFSLLGRRYLLRLAAQAAVGLAHSSIIGVIVSVESTKITILVSGGLKPDILSPLVVSLRLVVIVRFLELLDLFVDVVDQNIPLVSNLSFVSTKGSV